MSTVKRYIKVLMLSTVVPVLAFVITFAILQYANLRSFCKTLDIEHKELKSYNTELQLYVDSYGKLFEKYKKEFEKDSAKILAVEEFNRQNKAISKHGFGVVVYDDEINAITDTGILDDCVLDYLKEYTPRAVDYMDVTISLGTSGKYLVHSYVTEYSGETYTFWQILDLSTANEYMSRQKAVYLFISALVALIICVVILVWLFKYIFGPLSMLREATEQLKQGNLDIVMDYDESNDIGELCRNFDEMRKQLKKNVEDAILSEKESREMISNISHDLKTPLTAIKGYVEGLLDNVVANNPERKEKYLRTIYNKATDMDLLIDELALYSKLGTNRATYTFRKVDAKGYFKDCAETLAIELDAKGIEFEFRDNLEENTQIVADIEYLRRVINNIISNSVKNVPVSDGKIGISLADEGKYIRVDMSDNGKGIPAKDIPHIFDRFYRGDASRNTAQGGSGIGLSIVKKVIEEHGGKIWVSSKEGEGTTMSFVLKKST